MTTKEIQEKIFNGVDTTTAHNMIEEITVKIRGLNLEYSYNKSFNHTRCEEIRKEVLILSQCRNACKEIAGIKTVPYYCHY